MTKCQNLRFLLFKKKKKITDVAHQWNDGSSSGPQLSLRPLYCFCYSQREHVCRNFLTGISQFCCTILEGSVVGPDGLSGTEIHFLIYEPKAETSNLATFISLSWKVEIIYYYHEKSVYCGKHCVGSENILVFNNQTKWIADDLLHSGCLLNTGVTNNTDNSSIQSTHASAIIPVLCFVSGHT